MSVTNLSGSGKISLAVYNLNGQLAKKLVDSHQPPGIYAVNLNMRDTPSGMYFYKIHAGNFKEIRKMIKID